MNKQSLTTFKQSLFKITFMKKLFITSLFAASVVLASANAAYASGDSYGQSNCHVIYGGGQICKDKVKFTIDKKVQEPTKGGSYVDNLNVDNTKYAPANDVVFKITITNTGDKMIKKLDVTDNLPQYVTFASGTADYNKTNNSFTYTITNLDKGATHEQLFVVKVADANALPQNQGVICLTNNVKATDNDGSLATDSSSFCVERNFSQPEPQVFNKVPLKTVPNTGPGLFSLIALIPAGIAGYKLRNKSKIS